ncbi:nucleoside triphosphate pyrophosphohydrolase [Effusibacillus lacus]|uniref:MazG family protein n=1 Tax=Effusibacillus lacus TaxID=1348429 RepID=A0A292YGT2_9BACL|nr:nucleoside triphosphate pyrophosphohydrolase [Effusibacillus lacus]TCS74468.1 tetrapyrrole methylase family protein/MazG family protein [Effusibacillus lacus]GAX88658.1 MazG family protein [Effusibacillus lacus]
MSRIHVVGLGPGSWTGLPIGTYQILQAGKKIFLRTERHPVVEELVKKGVRFHPLDELYERAEDFESLYQQIVELLLNEAKKHGEIVYAVPGHPGVAERSVQIALQKGPAAGVEILLGPGHSFLDELLLKIGVDPTDGLLILDGTSLKAHNLNPSVHTLIVQVYNQEVAGEVKLTLMDIYPDDYPVTVARAVGVAGVERVERVPLYELDHLDWVDHLTTLHLPSSTEDRVTHRQFSKLVEIVEILRSPEGCPWDREQTHASIRKNVIEEAYEVAEAIDLDDPDALSEELGDLLLQVVLHSQIASEEGVFTIYDAIQSINDKLIRRHPHVFGDRSAEDADAAMGNWEEIKRREKETKGIPQEESFLDAVKNNMPAMDVSYKLQKKAAEVGFEWPDVEGVLKKLKEEIEELRVTEDKTEELGDVLFVLVNLARYLKVDPEEALSRTNVKFRRRFAYIEKKLSEQGKSFSDSSLEEMDAWWNESKKLEKI